MQLKTKLQKSERNPKTWRRENINFEMAKLTENLFASLYLMWIIDFSADIGVGVWAWRKVRPCDQ